MKMVKNLQRSLLISLISILLLAAVGCNSNPVSLYDGSDSPLSSSFDPGVTTKKPLDILWVIDNSGSMGEEQVALSLGLKNVAETISQSSPNLDVHVGVTTTSSPYSATPDQFFQNEALGKLVTSSHGLVYGNSGLLSRATLSTNDINTIKSLYKLAWDCSDDTKPSTPVFDDTFIENNRNNPPEILKAFPKTFREVAPNGFLSSESFIDSSGKFDKNAYEKAFQCLTFVGLGGNYIEKGLAAAINAVDPNGPNKGVLKQFLRPKAPLFLIIISDENDCSLGKNAKQLFPPKGDKESQADYDKKLKGYNQMNACGGRMCDFFNLPGFEERYPGLSVLIKPDEAGKEFIKHVQEVKGADFDPSNIYAFSITGPNQRMTSLPPAALPGTLVGSKTEPPLPYGPLTVDNNYFFNFKWIPQANKVASSQERSFMQAFIRIWFTSDAACEKDQALTGETFPKLISSPATSSYACASDAFGKATSGDRYLRFLNSFSKNKRYPTVEDASSSNVNKSGPLCVGDFGGVVTAINNAIKYTDACIPSEALSGCDNNASVGAKCGVGDSGTCQEQFHTTSKKLFCTSYIQVLATATDAAQQATLKASPDCVKDSYGTIAGFPNSCIIKPSEYKFKACASGSPGVELDFAPPSTIPTSLKGIPLQVRYTSVGTKSK